MDTEAIYSAVCAYGAAKCGGYTFDANDHIESVKRLLNEADEEHKSLLADNERLVDEVAELKAAYESQFKELRGCYARINVLEKALTAAHDHIDMAALEVSHCKDAAIISAALEKKHEGT